MKKIMFGIAGVLTLLLSGCASGGMQTGDSCVNKDTISDSSVMSDTTQQEVTELPLPDGVRVTKDEIIIDNGKPAIIDFWASWCMPCMSMKPIFAETAENYGKDINFISIDVDENPELSEVYEIHTIPCFIFVDKDGKELQRKVGSMNVVDFTTLIARNFPHVLP